MPARRKPARLMELSGSFAHNPQRRRNEPTPTGPLGAPPRHLDKLQLAAWSELESIAPRGLLTIADRWAVELAAHLMAQLRRDKGLRPGLLNQLSGLLGRLGLTPADRSRVDIPPPGSGSLRKYLMGHEDEGDPVEKYARESERQIVERVRKNNGGEQ